MSDCGSDIVKLCKLIKVPHLPCLAHVLNILAKKLIGIDADFSVPEDDETGDELDDIFALGFSGEVKTAVKTVKSSGFSSNSKNKATRIDITVEAIARKCNKMEFYSSGGCK